MPWALSAFRTKKKAGLLLEEILKKQPDYLEALLLRNVCRNQNFPAFRCQAESGKFPNNSLTPKRASIYSASNQKLSGILHHISEDLKIPLRIPTPANGCSHHTHAAAGDFSGPAE